MSVTSNASCGLSCDMGACLNGSSDPREFVLGSSALLPQGWWLPRVVSFFYLLRQSHRSQAALVKTSAYGSFFASIPFPLNVIPLSLNHPIKTQTPLCLGCSPLSQRQPGSSYPYKASFFGLIAALIGLTFLKTLDQ